jgi:hypothetical protein
MTPNQNPRARAARAAIAMASVLGAAIAQGEPAPRTLSFANGTRVELRTAGGRTTYSISTADGRSSGVRADDPWIRLRAATFDPRAHVPLPFAQPASGEVRLIQCVTPLLEEYGAALAALGVEVRRVVPSQTVIARVPAAAEAAVRALDFVRWVGPFPTAARLEPEVARELARGAPDAPRAYLVQLLRRGPAAQGAVADAVRACGGSARLLAPEGFLLEATLTPAQLAAIAARDEVLWIERADAPAQAIDNVRQDGGADELEQRTGLRGTGVRGEVLDSGLETTHPDFQAHPPILHGANTAQRGHGTSVHGIVFGTGAGDPLARGLLPDGQGIFASYLRLTDRYAHTAALLGPPYFAVFQTNSWGNGPSPAGYPSLSFEMDDLVLLYDLLMCQAFGNAGSTVAFRQAWAKNAVTVGGIQHRDTLDTGDDGWNGVASIGPATDGRIKPDLCYWNERIRTTAAPAGYTLGFGGTSAATPQVAGHFGLLFEMWHAEAFGNVAAGADVFASRPRSATARALVYGTAEPYAFAGAQHDLTRTHQGWGRPNVARLREIGGHALVIDEWRPLRNLEVARYGVRVAEGQDRLRATLVYTDPPGNSAAARHRVNDLSLRVTSPSGVTYWGNRGLVEGNASLPGGTANDLDTTEQVWLERPEPGAWAIEVIAHEVVQDAHLETPEVDADFALVVAPVARIVRDLGQALPEHGRDPVLRLAARGSFVARSPWRFDLAGATPGGTCWLVLGSRRYDQPFAGALLVPSPDRVLRLAVDDAGRARLSGPARADEPGIDGWFGSLPIAPRGDRFYAQAWAPDPREPSGWSASNALEIALPELR